MKTVSTSVRQLWRVLAVAVCASTMALTSCSGSSSNAPPLGVSDDLGGHWMVWATESGKAESGPDPLFLSVSGSTIETADISGTVSGANFEMTVQLQDGTSAVKGILNSAITALGTYETRKNNGKVVTGTFRMLKFTPTGLFNVSGSILGETITHSSNATVGTRKYLDALRTQLFEVEIQTGSAVLDFELDIDAKNLKVGNLVVGEGSGDLGVAVEFSTGNRSARAIAKSGTFEVTKYDAAGLTVKFTLNLDTSDTITGTADIKFDIEAWDPGGP